jgi:hypothetical protein
MIMKRAYLLGVLLNRYAPTQLVRKIQKESQMQRAVLICRSV